MSDIDGSGVVMATTTSSSTSICEKMGKIENVSIAPLVESAYLKPFRMSFEQNKRKRKWDFLRIHDSVAILIFNRVREVLIFVKQFRPPVFFNAAYEAQELQKLSDDGNSVDWSQVPPSKGVTLELCAGIMDKKELTDKETAKEEVLEECGYDVPLEKFESIIKLRSGVGTTASMTALFYVEVDDSMKVSSGGGNEDEGELIEVVEMSIPQVIDYMNQEYIPSPGSFAFAIMWFLHNRKP